MERLLPSRTTLSGPVFAVWLLGLTQIAGYGTLYYSFPILAPSMAAEFGWATSSVFGLFSLSLLAGGFIAPWTGRLMDRNGAARMMVWGSGLSAGALIWIALAPASLFLPGLIFLEMASGLALYDAAFATLAQRTGGQARNRIAQMTLIAGFASSLAWPFTSFLHDWLGWREVLLLFALLNLAFCMPVHWLLWKLPPAAREGEDPIAEVVAPQAPEHLRPRLLWLTAMGFALSGFVVAGVLILMVPLLKAMGMGAAAVGIAALFGPSQVLSRFAHMGFGKRISPLAAAVLSSALMGAACLVLMAAGASGPSAVLFAVLFGLGSGINSIVRGTVPLVLFGSLTYGSVLGQMAFVRLILNAAAPFAFAWLLEHAGPGTALLAMGVIGGLAIAAFAETARRITAAR